MATDPLVRYADASALVKLAVEESESAALEAYVDGLTLATSAIARVEVERAVRISSAGARSTAAEVLDRCVLIRATEDLLRAAADLASAEVRSLDAIHLASAQRAGAAEMIVYDVRLARAVRAAGLAVAAPGTSL